MYALATPRRRIGAAAARRASPQPKRRTSRWPEAAEAAGRLCGLGRRVDSWAGQAQKFQQIFGSNLTRYPALDDLVADVSLKKAMWQVHTRQHPPAAPRRRRGRCRGASPSEAGGSHACAAA